MADEGAPGTVTLPVAWVDSDDAPILFANQFLLQQIAEMEYVLYVGQVTPPPVIGTPEQQQAQLEQINFVPVRTLARLSLSQNRLDELLGVLQRVRSRADDPASGDQP